MSISAYTRLRLENAGNNGPPQIGNRMSEQSRVKTLEQVEKEHILSVLQDVRGNKTKAASLLGISVDTINRRLKSYEVSQVAEIRQYASCTHRNDRDD